MHNSLDIFNFSDYRQYIKAWIELARASRSSNLSRLSETIGVHTSFLAHVLSGAKNLSFEQAADLSDSMEHTSLEREFFFALVQIERAGTTKLKKYWSEKKSTILMERSKLRTRVGTHHELSAEDRAIFYSSWIYVAVFVATAINDSQTLEQIAERFRLSRKKAEEVLAFLVQTGICEKDNSKYKMGKSVVYLENESPLVVKHHTNWRMRAIQKMDTRQASELFFTSPMSISMSDFSKIREILAKSIQSTLEICKDSPSEEVVCLNIDFFKCITD